MSYDMKHDRISRLVYVPNKRCCHICHIGNLYILAESSYHVKNGSSIIMSKSLSKNLSNENKNTPENWHFFLTTRNQYLFSLLRLFDEIFDVIIDNPFLTL